MPKCGPKVKGNYTSLSHLQRAVASVKRTLKSLPSPSAQGTGKEGCLHSEFQVKKALVRNHENLKATLNVSLVSKNTLCT